MSLTVVDTTCFVALERIGQLDVLPRVFTEIAAPPTVVQEFGRAPEWLEVRAVSNDLLSTALRTQLHRGEAEVIALAAEIAAQSIVLDDKKARRIARELGLRPIGTVGVILRAKRSGVIPACRPLLDSLMRAGFYMSDALYREALRLAGEAD